MPAVIILSAAFLPGILWLLVMRWWDRREPEPVRLLIQLFLGGVIGGMIIALLRLLGTVAVVSSGLLPSLDLLHPADGLGSVAGGVLLLAGIHQLVIFAIANSLTARHQAFSQIVDGIVYTMTVAWGATVVENSITLLRAFTEMPLPGALAAPPVIFQLVFTTLMMGVGAGFAGLGLGLARHSSAAFGNTRDAHVHQLGVLARGLVEAIALDALFRFFLVLNAPRIAGGVVVLAGVYLFSRFAVIRLTRIFMPAPA